MDKDRIRAEIKARDALLDLNGIINFKYSVKKTLNMGNDSLREIEINLENLTVTFPNSRGVKDTYSVDVVVSVSPTEIASCLLVNLRLDDGSLLKEKRWTFANAEEADKFRTIVNAMNAIGPLVREIFILLDRDNKGYIDSVDLDVAVEEYCRDDPEFTEGSTFLMIDECYNGTEAGKVRLGSLLALMISADTQRVQSIQTLMREWLMVASERINALFAFRDSRICYDDGLGDVDFEEFGDDDEEMDEFRAMFDRQAVEANARAAAAAASNVPFAADTLNSSFSAVPSSSSSSTANDNGDGVSGEDTGPRHASTDSTDTHPQRGRRRMSVRSIKMHKSIIKSAPTTVSIISKPRSSACTTGSSVTDILGGEIILNTLHNVMFTLGPPQRDRVGYKAYTEGTLLLTNYRVVVADQKQKAEEQQQLQQQQQYGESVASSSTPTLESGIPIMGSSAGGGHGFRYGAPPFPSMHSIPLSCISRVEVEGEGSYELAVVCKDLRILRLSFVGNAKVETFPTFFRDVLSSCAFVPTQTDLFAFKATKLLNAQQASTQAAQLVKEAAVAMMTNSEQFQQQRNRSNTTITMSKIAGNRSNPLESHNSRVLGGSAAARTRSTGESVDAIQSLQLAEDDDVVVVDNDNAHPIITTATPPPTTTQTPPPVPTYTDPQSLLPIERSQSIDTYAASGIGLSQTHRPIFALPPPRRTDSSGGFRASPLYSTASTSMSGPSSRSSSLDNSNNTADGWLLFDPAMEYYRQGLIPHPDAGTVAPTAFSRTNSSHFNRDRDTSTSTDGIASSSSIVGISMAAGVGSTTVPAAGAFWRLWSDNYQLVDTYPSAFILPSALTDREVFDAAMFRSRCRLPALTWREPVTGACLVRSSQPMTGISSQTNVADKLLLNLYRVRGNPHDPREQKHPSTFYIIDCRSQLAANANAAFGKGVENWKALVNTRVIFCNIANIHTMRSSLESLHKVLMPWLPSKGNKTTTALQAGGLQILSSLKKAFGSNKESGEDGSSTRASMTTGAGAASTTSTSSSVNAGAVPVSSVEDAVGGVGGGSGGGELFSNNNELDARFLYSRIEDTGWLEHIRLVIQGAVLVAEKLTLEGCSVLVHCSDGWDRTAQVSSTAQLILDPYYRTLRGFFVLIEKDWCGFGHKFYDRLGHGRNGLGEEAKETSPVFLQWLDVVSQMLFQFPHHFEFTETLLVFIADQLHSCQFGSFLGNSEKERKVELKAQSRTNSLWTYILQPHVLPRFVNANYHPSHISSQTPLTTAAVQSANTIRSGSPAFSQQQQQQPSPARPLSTLSNVSMLNSSQQSQQQQQQHRHLMHIWPSARRVRLWERYFCRWDMEAHPRYNSCGEVWKDNWV